MPSVRRLEFVPTPAVLSARARGPFVPCPVCEADNERYLFHKTGARFVRCASCGLVYVNPPATTDRHYFDVDAAGQHVRRRDRALFQRELAEIVLRAASKFVEQRGRAPRDLLLVGRTLDGAPVPSKGSVQARVVRLGPEDTDRLSREGDVTPILDQVTETTDVLILNELLEACSLSAIVVGQLAEALPDDAMLVVVFSNVGSFPARLMRRHWPRFFTWKSVYFEPENLTKLMDNAGLRLVSQERRRTPYTLSYVIERLASGPTVPRVLDRLGVGKLTLRLPAGTSVAAYEKHRDKRSSELLSVIVPVFNEADYVGPVLEALLAKQLSIDKQVIVVESNSTDGSREILRKYEGTPGLQIIYEDKPRGKGAAVRRGLAAASGSIFLIQDADFEYDLDDYDALLEPILQRRTSFVLGSRSLGIDDWKVRRFASSRIKAFLMNFAQLVFAKTFNILYQQRTTDVNTMFKVFRRECIQGVDFKGDGFNFDIELVCRIVANGFGPMEVPVNYVSRGFDEGKKIDFLSDFFPSYSMFYRCRFSRPHVS
jgi:hypothetical protein